jgi:hypothetical protein
MLDSDTIHNLTREAKPVDYKTLRSYVRWAPSVEYVRRVMIPSLRLRHPTIWTHIRSKPSQYRAIRSAAPELLGLRPKR